VPLDLSASSVVTTEDREEEEEEKKTLYICCRDPLVSFQSSGLLVEQQEGVPELCKRKEDPLPPRTLSDSTAGYDFLLDSAFSIS
jgi:hypothetical protein